VLESHTSLHDEKKEKVNMHAMTPSKTVATTLADARYFLSRVVPRGDEEARRLSQVIAALEKISKG